MISEATCPNCRVMAGRETLTICGCGYTSADVAAEIASLRADLAEARTELERAACASLDWNAEVERLTASYDAACAGWRGTVRERDEARASLARVTEERDRLEELGRKQWGCAGADPRTGRHHHDDRCIPGLTAEVERLRALRSSSAPSPVPPPDGFPPDLAAPTPKEAAPAPRGIRGDEAADRLVDPLFASSFDDKKREVPQLGAPKEDAAATLRRLGGTDPSPEAQAANLDANLAALAPPSPLASWDPLTARSVPGAFDVPIMDAPPSPVGSACEACGVERMIGHPSEIRHTCGRATTGGGRG